MGVLDVRITMIAFDLPAPDRAKEGGVAYFCHELANRLSARGHEVCVVTLNEAPADAGYCVRRVPLARFFLRSRLLRYYLAPAVLRFMTFAPTDVIHSHGDSWCCFGMSAPVLRTFHGSSLDEAIHATSWIRRLNHFLSYPLEVISGLAADGVTAVSLNAAGRLPMPCKVIPDAVDTEVFRPGEKSTVPSILFVGTLSGRKRGELLLSAFRKTVVPRYPSAELWMVCGQPGPSVLGVRWFPKLTTEELANLYRKAWIFCLPSSYEGFGIPYIEAMASGTPVIATENAGAIELLHHRQAGWTVRDDDLGQALVHLLGDPATRAELGGAARALSESFSWDVVVAAFEDEYRRLLSRRSAENS